MAIVNANLDGVEWTPIKTVESDDEADVADYIGAFDPRRQKYYCNEIDPEYLMDLTAAELAASFSAQPNYKLPIAEADSLKEVNLISSKVVEDDIIYHSPALDIDIPMELYPSSTPGHWHVYFPTLRLSWLQYNQLMFGLSEAGIIEKGYWAASKSAKASYLRFPGEHKYTKEEIIRLKESRTPASAIPTEEIC